jgi:hypothetical protein
MATFAVSSGHAKPAASTIPPMTFAHVGKAEAFNEPNHPIASAFSNQGTVALNISSIAFGDANPGDFSQTNNCPSSLAAGGHCVIRVTFTPTHPGGRNRGDELTHVPFYPLIFNN